jgi:hypothetical protein
MKKDLLVPLILCASFTCQASDYYFKPVFSTKERYYTNIRLLPNPPQDNWVTTLSPGLNFGLIHENGELKSNFTWNQLFYTNQSSLNVSEQLFSADYQQKNERLQWGITGYYNNQSYLNTQGTVLGSAQFKNVMAKQLKIAPTVTYAINELNSLTLDYSYTNTAYQQNTSVFLTDYDYQLASGTFNHLYTEHDKLNLTLSSSRYNASARGLTTFNNVAQLGWQHSFSGQLVTYLAAGMNYSISESKNVPQFIPVNFFGSTFYEDPVTAQLYLNQRYENINKTGLGQVYQASVQKTFEKGSASLLGSQNQTPTSQGLQTQTQLSINATYNLNERWTSGLAANYSIYDFTGVQNSSLNRTYATIGPNINWKWTPEISIGFSYNYRQQEYKNSNQLRQDNNLQLQITYQPQTNYQVK